MVMEGINGNRDINGNNKARRGRMWRIKDIRHYYLISCESIPSILIPRNPIAEKTTSLDF